MITITETTAVETTAEQINEADNGKTIDEIYHDTMMEKYGWGMEDVILWNHFESEVQE